MASFQSCPPLACTYSPLLPTSALPEALPLPEQAPPSLSSCAWDFWPAAVVVWGILLVRGAIGGAGQGRVAGGIAAGGDARALLCSLPSSFVVLALARLAVFGLVGMVVAAGGARLGPVGRLFGASWVV